METELDGHQPLLVFDNHDNTRSWDRFGDGATPENKLRIAKLIATILYTTRSTALTYYGAEIGMTTHTPTRKEDVRDPIGITGWPKEKGRDGERTPMQWTPNPPAAGFSTNPHTWLPIGADYPTVNVQSEIGQPDTLLTWTHNLIDLRRGYPALHDGGIVMLDTTNPSVLSYVRTAPDRLRNPSSSRSTSPTNTKPSTPTSPPPACPTTTPGPPGRDPSNSDSGKTHDHHHPPALRRPRHGVAVALILNPYFYPHSSVLSLSPEPSPK